MTSKDTAPRGWQPVAGVETAKLRTAMLTDVTQFFARLGVLMVDTPALSLSAVSDANIESVSARLNVDPTREYFLHTSPEYCMKRLLAAGFPDIAQVCRVFRDGEAGRRHLPEFTMIEWYRRDFDLDAMMSETERLLSSLLGESMLDASPLRISYRDAFRTHAGVDPFEADIATLAECAHADRDLRARLGSDRDAWLDLTMLNNVAPAFDKRRLTSVFHYPASQAALARLNPVDAGIADRFEVYRGDLELANGYVELTDAAEQTRRFESDQETRRNRGSRTRPLDAELLAGIRSGLPECAGVAVGFDRLLMVRAGENDIRRVQHFPHQAM